MALTCSECGYSVSVTKAGVLRMNEHQEIHRKRIEKQTRSEEGKMRRMRQAAKVDDNQGDIVKRLRAHGAYVCIIGQPYDLLVGWRGHWSVLEVKDPSKSPKHQQLTPAQLDTLAKLRGSAPLHVVRTPEEALCAIGARPWPEVEA